MAGAGAGQGAEDRASEADLHRRPLARLRPGRPALDLSPVPTDTGPRPVRVLALVATDAGRASLRREVDAAAATYGGLARLCPHCGSDTHGRPRVPGRRDLHVSVAYGAGLAVLAVAPMPLGIDVEPPGPAPECFADRAAWTRAEAALKLTGAGIRRDPWADPPAGVRWTPLDGLPSDHVGSVATWERDGPLTLVEV